MSTFTYPSLLEPIFVKLQKYNIVAVIVGGYVRDFFLNTPSKDIDIELYNIDSLQEIIKILQEFGNLNDVGKSFGVIKLHYQSFDLDFSLPRRDNKTSKGHKGFKIVIDKNLNFKDAAKRRDFTINAIGFNTVDKKLLDYYNGLDDINKKILRAVDLKSFDEDPLRLFRAVGFSSRFNFKIEKNLFILMQKMVQQQILQELPKERVYEELKKIFLKSNRPSQAFKLLEKLQCQDFGLFQLFELNKKQLLHTYQSIDNLAKQKPYNITQDEMLVIMFSLLTFYIDSAETFLYKLTNNKTLINKVIKIHNIDFDIFHNNLDDYSLFKLAMQIEIRIYLIFLQSLYPNEKKLSLLEKKAKKLNIYEKPLKAFVGGKDLIAIGLKPSKKFHKILEVLYDKQMKGDFSNKEEALNFVVKYPSYF